MADDTHDRVAWLQGGDPLCEHLPAPGPVFRLVLLGAPGVGKGTQGELLGQRLGACHLSTGDLFRAANSLPQDKLSPAMRTALSVMARGELVEDETVLAMVRERSQCMRCQGGFLLDGFPRTVGQAEALEGLLESEGKALDAVINYELAEAVLVARLHGRRTCPDCKAVYHESARPPLTPGVCDHCGATLYQREDDRMESLRVRLVAYRNHTKPLIDFYRRRNLLVSVEALGSPEAIHERTLKAIGYS